MAMRRVDVESFLKNTRLAESRPYVTVSESKSGGVSAPGVLYFIVYRTGIEFDPDRVAAFIKMLREGGTKVSAV